MLSPIRNIPNNMKIKYGNTKYTKYAHRIDMVGGDRQGGRDGERERCEHFQMIHVNHTACATPNAVGSSN